MAKLIFTLHSINQLFLHVLSGHGVTLGGWKRGRQVSLKWNWDRFSVTFMNLWMLRWTDKFCISIRQVLRYLFLRGTWTSLEKSKIRATFIWCLEDSLPSSNHLQIWQYTSAVTVFWPQRFPFFFFLSGCPDCELKTWKKIKQLHKPNPPLLLTSTIQQRFRAGSS